MKVLALNPVGTLGGAERVLIHSLRAIRLHRPDWRVSLITLAGGPLLDEAGRLGVTSRVEALPAAFASLGESANRGGGRIRRLQTLSASAIPQGLALSRFVARLRNLVRVERPDLVYSNGIKTHLLSRLVVPRDVPVVWHIHDYLSQRALTRRMISRASSHVRRLVAISRSVATDLQTVLPHTPVDTVLNCVDVDRFRPPLETRRGDRITIGLVATFAIWKGHRLFLEAAAELVSRRPDLNVSFVIIGGPIYQTPAQWRLVELQQIAQDLHLSGRVEFVPFQSSVEGVYHTLDVVVHASTRPEPFGLTIAEAMASGRPVIVARAGGAAELFTDGVDAVGFPLGDRFALVDAMLRLCDSPDDRRRIGEAARRTAVERFDPARYSAEFLSVLERTGFSNTR